jgi:hypothetical protein
MGEDCPYMKRVNWWQLRSLKRYQQIEVLTAVTVKSATYDTWRRVVRHKSINIS